MKVNNLVKEFLLVTIFASSNFSVAQGCAVNLLGKVVSVTTPDGGAEA